MSLDRIVNLFEEGNFQWKIDGVYRLPTLDDVDDAVGRAIEAIADSPDLTQIEFGRLIVQKNGQHFDVYMHVHEIPIN